MEKLIPRRSPEIVRKLYNIVSLVSQEEILAEAVEIAVKHKVTVYDVLYIAAAKKFNAQLATADKVQAEAAEKEGVKVVYLA